MQARPVRPSRLLGHHLMQAPDDGTPGRRPQRHAQPEGVDRYGVGGGGGVKIVNHACCPRGEGVVALFMCSRLDATTIGSIQRLQSDLQLRKHVRW